MGIHSLTPPRVDILISKNNIMPISDKLLYTHILRFDHMRQMICTSGTIACDVLSFREARSTTKQRMRSLEVTGVLMSNPVHVNEVLRSLPLLRSPTIVRSHSLIRRIGILIAPSVRYESHQER